MQELVSSSVLPIIRSLSLWIQDRSDLAMADQMIVFSVTFSLRRYHFRCIGLDEEGAASILAYFCETCELAGIGKTLSESISSSADRRRYCTCSFLSLLSFPASWAPGVRCHSGEFGPFHDWLDFVLPACVTFLLLYCCFIDRDHSHGSRGHNHCN